MQKEMVIERPYSWIFVGKITGWYTPDMVDQYIEGMERTASGARSCMKKAYFFHEWSQMRGYESICRKKMTDWSLENEEYTERHHVLIKSAIVYMGVQTALLLIDKDIISIHKESKREEFDKVLAKALAEAKKSRRGL